MYHAIIESAKVTVEDEEASCGVDDIVTSWVDDNLWWCRSSLLLAMSAAILDLFGCGTKLFYSPAVPFPHLDSACRKSRVLLWDTTSPGPDTSIPNGPAKPGLFPVLCQTQCYAFIALNTGVTWRRLKLPFGLICQKCRWAVVGSRAGCIWMWYWIC